MTLKPHLSPSEAHAARNCLARRGYVQAQVFATPYGTYRIEITVDTTKLTTSPYEAHRESDAQGFADNLNAMPADGRLQWLQQWIKI